MSQRTEPVSPHAIFLASHATQLTFILLVTALLVGLSALYTWYESRQMNLGHFSKLRTEVRYKIYDMFVTGDYVIARRLVQDRTLKYDISLGPFIWSRRLQEQKLSTLSTNTGASSTTLETPEIFEQPLPTKVLSFLPDVSLIRNVHITLFLTGDSMTLSRRRIMASTDAICKCFINGLSTPLPLNKTQQPRKEISSVHLQGNQYHAFRFDPYEFFTSPMGRLLKSLTSFPTVILKVNCQPFYADKDMTT